MIRVTFLTTIPSPYRVAFFNEWGKLCDLTVIFERKASAERDDTWKDVDVRNFKAIFLEGFHYKANKAFCPSVIKTIRNTPFDVFIIGGYNTPTAMLVAQWLRNKKIPYILNADGGYAKKDRAIVEVVKRHFISSASMWICTSEKTKEYFIHYGAQPERIFKYPFTSIYRENMVSAPLDCSEKGALRQELGIPEQKVIMSVGQFIPRKGFDVLLESKKRLPSEVGLYIIGGTETEEYRDIVETRKLKDVHFLPFMKPFELAKYYQAADLFAFPTREDIWGLVINEAAAYGLPIVTTEGCIAGLEMVRNGVNGYIVPVNDEKALANAINKILNDDAVIAEFGRNSIKAGRQYTYEGMAQVHQSLVEEFVHIHEGVKS